MAYEWLDDAKRLIGERRGMMLEAERAIWAHPQTGFKEWFANNYLKERFEKMGFELTEAGSIPGFYFDIDTGREGPTVCLMGELDSVICREHPEADPQTGAVHACGHNCQSSALLGIAWALKDEALLSKLSGRIRIMAVPAEELLEIGERSRMRAEGKIRYLGGKVEFISRGYFDGVDMAILIHTSGGEEARLSLGKGSNGCMAKNVVYKGVAAHAGGSPDQGVNALYAAQAGLNNVNALRETFRDGDHVRFHPIITEGGAIVNAIPSHVVVESYVRAASFEAMKEANVRVNRALAAGALAIGAQVDIQDSPGYMPLNNDVNLKAVLHDAGAAVLGEEHVTVDEGWSCGSTDVGDVSCIMPAIMPYMSGAKGAGHGADYYVVDPDIAVVQSALVQVCAACVLLENDAERARFVKANAKPPFASAQDFLNAVDSITLNGDAIRYDGDRAVVSWARAGREE